MSAPVLTRARRLTAGLLLGAGLLTGGIAYELDQAQAATTSSVATTGTSSTDTSSTDTSASDTGSDPSSDEGSGFAPAAPLSNSDQPAVTSSRAS